MSTLFRSTCALVALALVLILAWAAGASTRILVKADIPFEFLAAGKLMPAGRYIIEPTSIPTTIQMRGDNGSAALVPIRIPCQSADGAPELVFDKSAGTPKLAGIRYTTPNSATFTAVR